MVWGVVWGGGCAIINGDRVCGDIMACCWGDIEMRVLVGKVEDMLDRACEDWELRWAMGWPEVWRAMKWVGWWVDSEMYWFDSSCEW